MKKDEVHEEYKGLLHNNSFTDPFEATYLQSTTVWESSEKRTNWKEVKGRGESRESGRREKEGVQKDGWR